MNFDLQRFSESNLIVRQNGKNYRVKLSDTEIPAPRLAVRHNDKNLYAALSDSADKPRLAVFTGGAAKYIPLLPKSMITHLPFAQTVTEDKFANVWTTFGEPVIEDDATAISGKSLKLDGDSYLQSGTIMLGGQDFTVDGWVNMTTSTAARGRVFAITNPDTGLANFILAKDRDGSQKFELYSCSYADCSSASNSIHPTTSVTCTGSRIHFELVYQYAAKTMTLFIDGVNVLRTTGRPQYKRLPFNIYIGASKDGQYKMTGSIEHFRVFDGVALHTENFTPPTFGDYYRSVWLPCNQSVTEDRCDNSWITFGNPVIQDDETAISGKSLYLDGDPSGLFLGNIEFGGQDFTIDFYMNFIASPLNGRIFSIQSADGTWKLAISISSTGVWHIERPYITNGTLTTRNLPTPFGYMLNARKHVEIDYSASYQTMHFYFNGTHALGSWDIDIPQFPRQLYSVIIGFDGIIGSIEHFRIFDGVALHLPPGSDDENIKQVLNSCDFTPPTAADYV